MKKSPSEIAEQIFEVWGDECERVGATTFSRHSLECLKGEIIKAIEAERARLTPPAEEEMRKIFEEWFLSRYKESSSSLSKEVAARTASDFQFSAGFRAAFKWMEEKP